jgi:DNA-binding transcriptional ArsR family regulator
MIPESIDPTDVPLSALFRFAGQVVNFKILRELSDSSATPTDLANLVDAPRSTISDQLSKLRTLGFVTFRKRGRQHHYRVPDELPTLQHELIMELIKVDHTDPDRDFAELPDRDPRSDDVVETIREKQTERFKTRLALLVSDYPHPGLSLNTKKESLKQKLNQLDREIRDLKWEQE